MKKIIQYITIMMLMSNVCWGQQFVNGNFSSSGTNWTSGTLYPHYSSTYNGNNTYADLTGSPTEGSGNGVTISQTITFPVAGCYMLSFDLGTAKDAEQPKYYTAGIKTSIIINNIETAIGQSYNINTTGSFDAISWVPQTVGPVYIPAGNATFVFKGNNGFATTGRIMAMDNISLNASTGCVLPCVCNSTGLLPGNIIRDNIPVNLFPNRKDTAQVLQGDKVRFEIQVPCSNAGCGQHLAEMISPSGQTVATSPTIINDFPLTECGVYKLAYKVQCGTQECEKDTFYFNSRCCTCPPLPNIYYNTGSQLTKGKKIDCSKNSVVNIKCQQQVNIQAFANCQGDGCTNSKVNISVAGPGVNYSTAEDENVLAFFAMQKGDYVVTTTSTCNGKTCTPCKVTFHVEECKCPPPPCCKTPMQVSFNKADIKFQYAAETRVTVPFQLNGGGKKFTQVRANIVGFDIYSDNQKCIDCFNDSKLWGSIYNGTLSGFNPTYTGKNIGNNVNTREVVFANPVAQSINTTNLELKLFLPPAQTLTCCNVYADMYIKITYRDNECNECDTIIPVRVSLVKTKSGKPIDINLPGNPPPGVAKAKAWYVNCCPEPHPWKSWR